MIEDKTGQYIPNVTFRIRQQLRWITKTSEDFFRDKRVAVFAIPGAFTPVCSSLHLPSYNDLYDSLRANGIDDVYCLAVNDGFVLEAWKKAERADKITMLPDVDGEFSRKMGFLVHKSEMCLGDRSWRYSMIVNDCKIERMFIEPEGQSNDPYGESSAETMLKFLNPSAKLPDSVSIFTKHGCPDCEGVKDLLGLHKVHFEELVLNEQFTIKTVKAMTSSTFLPQIFMNGKNISIEDLRTRFNSQKRAA